MNTPGSDPAMALRCSVEHRKSEFDQIHNERLLKFVVIPEGLKLSQLLSFVLEHLDVRVCADECSAQLVIPHWRSLSLDEICEEPEQASAVTLLSQMSNIVTLRILIPTPEAATLTSRLMRDLLKSLMLQQPGCLTDQLAWFRQVGCPLDEAVLKGFAASPDEFEFPTDSRRLFSDWHGRICLQYLQQVALDSCARTATPPSGYGEENGEADDEADGESEAEDLRVSGHPVSVEFDEEHEAPLLRQWFACCSQPTSQQVQQLAEALSHLPHRLGRQAVQAQDVLRWFKSARAECSRQPQQTDVSEESLEACDLTIGSEMQPATPGEKRRRTRIFIDPATEIPQLERWFALESHPTSSQFQQFASTLNSMPFRQRQPKLEAKNVQLWFKNHRAKVKRERLESGAGGGVEPLNRLKTALLQPHASPEDSDSVGAACGEHHQPVPDSANRVHLEEAKG